MKSNTTFFAEHEFEILAAKIPDAVVLDYKKEIIALCEAFGNSGQSGGSAPYVASAIVSVVEKLLNRKPLSPIMGKDDEWINVTHLAQNDSVIYQH